jgi:hypothetical protein
VGASILCDGERLVLWSEEPQTRDSCRNMLQAKSLGMNLCSDFVC